MSVKTHSVMLAAVIAIAASGADVHHSKLFSEIIVDQLTDANKATFLADVRASGIDQVELAMIDFYDIGSARAQKLAKLRDAIRYFEGQGLGVTVWFDTLGYGYQWPKAIAPRLANMTRLEAFSGKRSDALCPADPAVVALVSEMMRDFARAGAKALLIDDDFIQSVRPGLGCVCPRHLDLVAKQIGHPVTAAEIQASFTGAPNALRRAFLDVSGEVAMDSARAWRKAVDAVSRDIVIGLAASYTHYDVEGVDIAELVQTLAGSGKRGFFRISGAPYWSTRDRCYAGAGLESVFNFVRLQTAWLRNSNITLFDENDPYPRKAAVCPAWKTELYDKVSLAEGTLARHKYMLCYGAYRTETAYLDEHLANVRDDARLARLFAGTEDAGLRVFYPQHSIRESTLPIPYAGDKVLMTRFSHPIGADLLSRNGFATCFAGNGPAFVFGSAAVKLSQSDLASGVILDRSAAQILASRGIKIGGKSAILDFDLDDVSFKSYEAGTHRDAILQAYRQVSGFVPEVRFEVPNDSHARFYPLVKRNPISGRYSVLLENFENHPIDIRFITSGKPQTHETMRGDFQIVNDQLWIKGLAPHAYTAATFSMHLSERQ